MRNSTPPADPRHPQLELFCAGLPRRPYATDRLGSRLLITSQRAALRRRYLQVNPPNLRVMCVFDVDRPAAVLAWEDADLPPPLWTCGNPANGHAHLGWALDGPVLLGPGHREGPMRYLVAVESLMRERLQADPSYGGLLTKNPTHPAWRTLWGPPRAYSLGELAEWLPGLEKHCPRGRPELSGLGRNVDCFDYLRYYAYREIRLWWAPPHRQGVYVAWLTHLYERAQSFTADEHPVPLDHRESHHIAKSVAHWVWTRFSAERLSAVQAARGSKAGRRSGEVRRERTAERDARIVELHAAGWSGRAIARAEGLAVSTVQHVLRRRSVHQVELSNELPAT